MDLPDDILGAILERIDSQVSLLRAASTCKRWRSIIADAAFLRRFRSLHAATVAGDYCNYPLSFIPSSSSSSNANHYSLDFLPDHNGPEDYFRVEDNRGSLLLMKHSIGIRYLVVCEPLTRRYKRIPPPLQFLLNEHQPPELRLMNAMHCMWCVRGFYLIDGSGEEEAGSNIGMSNFRVVCEHYMDRSMHVMLFSPDDGRDTSYAWIEKDIGSIVEAGVTGLRKVGRASGSWYFCDEVRTNILIVLDGRTGEFSTSMMPTNESWEIRGHCNYCVTKGRDGKPRVCSVVDGSMRVFAMCDESEWALEKSLLLEEATRGLPCYKPALNRCVGNETRGPGFVILLFRTTEMWTVSIDIETMKVTSGPVENMKRMVYRCELPWPPALNACVDKRP